MIKVNFFINKPSDYETFKSLYTAMDNDRYGRFKVRIYQNVNTWKPNSFTFADYSIVTSPYNMNFKNLSKKSGKIAHISYGPLIKRFVQYPTMDLQCIWKYFIGDKFNASFLKTLGEANKIIKLGHPKFDLIQRHINKADVLKKYNIETNKKIILYTPTIQLSNGTRSEYSMFKYVIKDIINIATELNMLLIIKGHPKLFLNLPKSQHMNFSNYKNVLFTQTNEYADLLQIADVFISDPSGIIFEYLYTKKPIILLLPIPGYKHPHEIAVFKNPAVIEFGKVSYLPKNIIELKNVISNILKGNDPLYSRRKSLLKEFFFNFTPIGKKISEYIANDYCKCFSVVKND